MHVYLTVSFKLNVADGEAALNSGLYFTNSPFSLMVRLFVFFRFFFVCDAFGVFFCNQIKKKKLRGYLDVMV